MQIEFGICAKDLSEQLSEFNVPKEKTDCWQSVADFIITAHISHAVGDKQFEKLNALLGNIIAKELKERGCSMKFFLYGNGGGIDEVKKELTNPKETFETIKQACASLAKQRGNAFDIEDLYVHYYGYDERIEKDVYIIATGRYGKENYIKKYGSPQFVSYMVTVDEMAKEVANKANNDVQAVKHSKWTGFPNNGVWDIKCAENSFWSDTRESILLSILWFENGRIIKT